MNLRNIADTGCQFGRVNRYCPTCHSIGRIPHEKGCKDFKVSITAAARFPRKNASKKTWDKFYDKFVLQKDLKDKFEQMDKKSKKKYRYISQLCTK